jgi:hypothetical protein
MKWSYRLVKIGRGFHICEVYVGKNGEPLSDIRFSVEDFSLPQWVIKDLFQKPLELKNNKFIPYELRSKKS